MKEGLPRTLLTEALSKPRGESQKCRCGDSGSSLQVRSGPRNSGWVHSVLWESPGGWERSGATRAGSEHTTITISIQG